jgi:GNAT superfamily N-acetyltransferase
MSDARQPDHRFAFEVCANPSAKDLAVISDGLNAFNAAQDISTEKHPLTIFLRGAEGNIDAGLSGYTAWGWLYIRWLWVAEQLRGNNVAGGLLKAAEAEALSRDCHGAYIDTFSPAALKVYIRHGYSIFGELADFPPGHTRSFLQKPLPFHKKPWRSDE